MSTAGFTGTSDALTGQQLQALRTLLVRLAPQRVAHGDCVGADAAFDTLCAELGIHRTAHPGHDDVGASPKRAHCAAEHQLPVKPYLTRNKSIVLTTSYLIACPNGFTEQRRSGTWATIRFARKVNRQRYIIWPDGALTVEAGK